jgi:flavoprotein
LSGAVVAGVGHILDDIIDIVSALSSAPDNSIYLTLSKTCSVVSLGTNDYDLSFKLTGSCTFQFLIHTEINASDRGTGGFAVTKYDA